MSLSHNLKQISDAFKERHSVRKAINKINKNNNKERKDELIVNSVINGLINVYLSVKEQARLTNIELEGVVIEPKNVLPSKAGTVQDARYLIEAAQQDPKFSSLFTLRKRSNQFGKEQYVMTEKKTKL